MTLTKPVTIKFTFTPSKLIVKLSKFLWAILPWIIIAILLSSRPAGASGELQTVNVTRSKVVNSQLTLPKIIDPSTELITTLEATQKPLPPPPASIAPIEPEPIQQPVFSANYYNTYTWGNCTEFVASVLHVPDNLSHAKYWDDNASEQGFTVSTIPRVGSVAQSDAGYYGHVAVVEAIDGPSILIKEMNVKGLNVISERWVSSESYEYIYF